MTFSSAEQRATLRVGAWLSQSRVNGPGCRFVLWLQGCSLQCAGCCNPAFQSYASGDLFTVQEVYEMIVKTPDIEGVTYSGGEPFEQARALALLSRRVRESGLTVMAYSGHTYKALCERHDTHVDELLGLLDVLIDGPFEAQHAAPLLWRGSRNQNVHFLADCYHLYTADVNREHVDVEFCIDGDKISVTGAADDDVLLHLTEKNNDLL
jgi:anaerobic ribonucleoside-triphosphate reductase activating protein